jgi:hypothetical protein
MLNRHEVKISRFLRDPCVTSAGGFRRPPPVQGSSQYSGKFPQRMKTLLSASRFFLGNEGSLFGLDGVFTCGVSPKDSCGTGEQSAQLFVVQR